MNLAPPKIVAQDQVKYSDFHCNGKQASVGASARTSKGVYKEEKKLDLAGLMNIKGHTWGSRNLMVGRLRLCTASRICLFARSLARYSDILISS